MYVYGVAIVYMCMGVFLCKLCTQSVDVTKNEIFKGRKNLFFHPSS